MESHDQFAPTRGRFWRLKIDQSTCDTDNIARLYELQRLAPIPGRACEKSVHITGAGATRANGEIARADAAAGADASAASADASAARADAATNGPDQEF